MTDAREGRADRATDGKGLGGKVVHFFRTYNRDVWLFVITVFMLVAGLLAYLEFQDTERRATDARNRACISIPIQVKALEAAVAADVISQDELDLYQTIRPKDCPKSLDPETP